MNKLRFFLKLTICILLFIISMSCSKGFGPSFDYKEEELIKLSNFVSNPELEYKCLGSYSYKGDTIITDFYIDHDKYQLTIIKFDSINANANFKINKNKSFKYVNSVYTILSGDNYELKYNLSELSKLGEKSSIHFSSDGNIKQFINNDSIKIFNVHYNKFTLYFNDLPDVRMYNESIEQQQLVSEIAFYRDRNNLFFLMLTPSYNTKINDGDILKYLKY